MKKKIIIGFLMVAVISVVSFNLFQNSTSNINEGVLKDLVDTAQLDSPQTDNT
ncbi:MAG: hypothetical protein U9Q88_01375 [Bacillota bacterium]|nr:hypothetical protein [Bacillota bacterium]